MTEENERPRPGQRPSIQSIVGGQTPPPVADWQQPAPSAPQQSFSQNKPESQPVQQESHQKSDSERVSHGIKYSLKGNDTQFVEIELAPKDEIVGEITSMLYYEQGVDMKVKMNVHANQKKQSFMDKMLGIGMSVMTGEKIFMATFSNTDKVSRKVAFAAPYSGKIIPFDLKKVGGIIFCAEGTFLCATSGTVVGVASLNELGGGFLGAGFSLDKIVGDGIAFIHCGGSLVQKKLEKGEVLHVVTGATVAKQPSVKMVIKMIRNVGITGEGHRLTELTGPGYVWIQSLPFSLVQDRVFDNVAARLGINTKKKGIFAAFGKK